MSEKDPDPTAPDTAKPRDKPSASGVLLERAVAAFGVDALATKLQIEPDRLQTFSGGGFRLTLAQQHALAVAVLTLSEDHPQLRRRASALLGQVRAAENFDAGTTGRHANRPER